MEGLNLDSILSGEELENLFTSDTEESAETTTEESNKDPQNKDTTTEEVNIETLFDETPESVGSEETQDGQEDTSDSKKTGASPNNNFYSSIAKALKEDGVFPDLDDATADSIKEAEDFAELIEQQVKAQFDERQRRIDEALKADVEPSIIRQYENTLGYLNSITEDAIKAETNEGEALRKQLIYQDLINRGYSKEEATEELDEIFANGSDTKKALRALTSNKDFFDKGYKQVLEEAKAEAKKEEDERKKQSAELKKSILEDDKAFKDISLDKNTRQKVYDSISKPVFKDPTTGELLTALQKYERDHKTDFLKNVGLIFTLTDGFKNLDGLVQPKVRKEVKKSLRELEHTLNNTARNSDGTLKFVSGVSDSPESMIGKGWDLDI